MIWEYSEHYENKTFTAKLEQTLIILICTTCMTLQPFLPNHKDLPVG